MIPWRRKPVDRPSQASAAPQPPHSWPLVPSYYRRHSSKDCNFERSARGNFAARKNSTREITVSTHVQHLHCQCPTTPDEATRPMRNPSPRFEDWKKRFGCRENPVRPILPMIPTIIVCDIFADPGGPAAVDGRAG